MKYTGPERRQSSEEVREIIKETIHETLTVLGLDVKEPLEIQQDMAWIRSMRRGTEGARRVAFTCIITTVIPAVLYLIWRGIKG